MISLSRADFFLSRLILFDVIFLGPVGIRLWSEISERHILLALSVLITSVVFLRARTVAVSTLYAVVLTSIIVIFWGLILPFATQGGVENSIREITPLGYILFIPSIFRVLNGRFRNRIRRDFILWSTILAIIVIVLWYQSNILGVHEYALGVKYLYGLGGGMTSNIYIGPMPDGSFRIFWISCIIFPWAILILKNTDKYWPIYGLIFFIAAFGTGTRAIIYMGFMSFLLSFYFNLNLKVVYKNLAILFIIFLTAYLAVFLQIDESRVYNISNELASDSVRYFQTLSLLEAWSDSPLLGQGFGASASYIRSVAAQFSYEMTHVALLMKVGLVGFFLIICVIFLLTRTAGLKFSLKGIGFNRSKIAFIYFLILTAFNPYLLTIHGLILFGVILAVQTIKIEKSKAETLIVK
jgi:hypothetical protein